MKQRKIKLLSSFASLLLIVAVMSIGVWATASQTVNVTTTVKFVATGVKGSILGTLTGLDGTTYYYNSTNAQGGEAIAFSPKSTPLANWTLGDEEALDIDNTEGVANDIVYSFIVTNSSTTSGITPSLTAVDAGTNLQITSVTQNTTPVTATDNVYTLSSINAGGNATITITFNVIDDSSNIESADISFTLNLIQTATT